MSEITWFFHVDSFSVVTPRHNQTEYLWNTVAVNFSKYPCEVLKVNVNLGLILESSTKTWEKRWVKKRINEPGIMSKVLKLFWKY